jgi:hypothetical protein
MKGLKEVIDLQLLDLKSGLLQRLVADRREWN